MDLSRAKTILIIAFFALNLFLGYRLWISPPSLRSSGVLSSEDADRAREALQKAGFEVIAAIPRQIPRLSLLHVSRLPQPGPSLAKAFFGEDVKGIPTEGGGVLYAKGVATVNVANNGQAVFSTGSARSSSVEETRQGAERFLRERNLWQDDLRYDQVIPLNALGSRIRFFQTYQGFPLFFCVAEVFFEKERVTEARLYRVEPLGFSNNELPVISAAEAIETFLEQKPDFPDKRIIDISLGYFSGDYNAERWEIVPVWRVAAHDGTVFYVNAFTGEAETAAM